METLAVQAHRDAQVATALIIAGMDRFDILTSPVIITAACRVVAA
jgi:hypothetical protein